MQLAEYKFERFSNPAFPVYLSVQSGRRTLAQIHYHTSAEIMQVMEGRVRLFADGTNRECEKGEIILIPPSAVHEVVSLTEDAAIRGVVYEPSLTETADASMLFGAGRRMQYAVGVHEEGYPELCSCLERIQSFYGEDSVSARMQIISGLLQAEAVLIRLFDLEESAASREYQKLQPVLQYMREHYAEKISISQLSSLIHVCDDRLIRLFKQVTGETPVAYLTNLRMEACLRLLSSTEDSIASIAEQTGFGSDTYMTRVFRQRLDTTPGKYRRR